jgi:hypothetical protein
LVLFACSHSSQYPLDDGSTAFFYPLVSVVRAAGTLAHFAVDVWLLAMTNARSCAEY